MKPSIDEQIEAVEPDWRKILVAYVHHVNFEEGTDFLGYPIDGLTPEESAALHEAVAESAVSDEYRAVLLACAKQCREDYDETE